MTLKYCLVCKAQDDFEERETDDAFQFICTSCGFVHSFDIDYFDPLRVEDVQIEELEQHEEFDNMRLEWLNSDEE